MLVYFTDAMAQERIAINPKYVTAVFVAKEGDLTGKTIIGLMGGNVVVEESQIDVVGTINGQL